MLDYKFEKLTIYKDKLHIELNTPKGGLWRTLDRKGNLALRGAKAMVGVQTGALKRSIRMNHYGNTQGQKLVITAGKNYALKHHEGTRPHTITPKDQGGVLVFSGRSRVVRTTTVNHPGTRANKFLSSQLHHFRLEG
jgi:hypothetical protein